MSTSRTETTPHIHSKASVLRTTLHQHFTDSLHFDQAYSYYSYHLSQHVTTLRSHSVQTSIKELSGEITPLKLLFQSPCSSNPIPWHLQIMQVNKASLSYLFLLDTGITLTCKELISSVEMIDCYALNTPPHFPADPHPSYSKSPVQS